jgi:hypothetical protein
MSAPPFTLLHTDRATDVLNELKQPRYSQKRKKVLKALRLLQEQGPAYPGLNVHQYQSVGGPNGEPLWECYVENRTPNAWRIWWCYGPGADSITIVDIGPQP